MVYRVVYGIFALVKGKVVDRQDGMTLIEMLLCLVLSSIFFIMLFSVVMVAFRHDHTLRREQKMFYEINKVRQFILEEMNLAESVCIYVYRDEIVETDEAIDRCHTSHNTIQHDVTIGEEEPVKKVVFDRGKRNKNHREISTTLKRKTIKNNGGIFELDYQGNTLTDCVTKFVVKQVDGIFYMTLAFEDSMGEVYETTFSLPVQDKEEKGDTWFIEQL